MPMKTDNKSFKGKALILLILAPFILMVGFMSDSQIKKVDQNTGFKYNGTYSLYVDLKDNMGLHWITNTGEKGFYEILNQNDKVVASGETDSARIHKVVLDKDIKRPFTLRFGSEKSGMEQVKIKSEFELEATRYKRVDSIYVVGDVHGRYDQMTNLLINANVIDNDLNWTAGKSHVVFLGDLFDRGDDVIKVLWFIHDLEEKAALKGGKVHLVLGNHEIMVMTKDLRYVSRKEQNVALAYKIKYDELFHPLDSYLGSWLRSKVSLLKIDQVVMAHGGILDIGPISLEEFNNKAHYYMKDPMYLEMMRRTPDSSKYSPEKWIEMKSFFYVEDAPYWYRGYVLYDTLGPQLNTMLRKHLAKIHVVAHTTRKTITQKYEGKLLTTDLDDAATELLMLVKHKKKYNRYKIDSQGIQTELE